DRLREHLPEPGKSDLRRFEWYCLLGLCDRGPPAARDGRVIRSPFTLPAREDMIRSVAFSPDGPAGAAAGWDGQVLFWDVAAQKPGPTLDCGGRVAAVTFAPGRDANVLACAAWDENWVATRGPSGQVLLYDVTRAQSRTLPGILGSFQWPLPG